MAKKKRASKTAKQSERPTDGNQTNLAELLKLPGTPESRLADHQRVQEIVTSIIRDVRAASQQLLDTFDLWFDSPDAKLTRGHHEQLEAKWAVCGATGTLIHHLQRLPYNVLPNGTRLECPPTWCGEIVPHENRSAYIKAMTLLRPLSHTMDAAAREVYEPFLSVPQMWVADLKKASRLLAFVEPPTTSGASSEEKQNQSDWPILAPQDLRKLFHIEQDALKLRLVSQEIPNVFINTKKYKIKPNCLPTNWERTIGRVK